MWSNIISIHGPLKNHETRYIIPSRSCEGLKNLPTDRNVFIHCFSAPPNIQYATRRGKREIDSRQTEGKGKTRRRATTASPNCARDKILFVLMEAWERLFMMVAIQAGRFFKLWATTMPRLCPLRPARAVSPIHPARGISFPGKANTCRPVDASRSKKNCGFSVRHRVGSCPARPGSHQKALRLIENDLSDDHVRRRRHDMTGGYAVSGRTFHSMYLKISA